MHISRKQPIDLGMMLGLRLGRGDQPGSWQGPSKQLAGTQRAVKQG
jgi:hypothetical protein